MPYRTQATTVLEARDQLVKQLLSVDPNRRDEQGVFRFELVENIREHGNNLFNSGFWCINQFVLDTRFFVAAVHVIIGKTKLYGGKVGYDTQTLFYLTNKERKAFKQLIKLRERFLSRIEDEILVENKARRIKEELNKFIASQISRPSLSDKAH